jgi:hypothetical protein
MICPDCDGKRGKVCCVHGEPGFLWLDCATCGGHGFVHCCEGDQLMPIPPPPTAAAPSSAPSSAASVAAPAPLASPPSPARGA